MARPARYGRKICEHHRQLDIHRISKKCSFHPGLRFSADLTGSVTIETEANDALVLEYDGVRAGTAERVPTKQRVPIVWTGCHLGGCRPWFLCGCGRRAAILYLGAGGEYRCRHCCELAYESQSEAPHHRAIRKARKIRKLLGGTPSIMDPFPGRPRQMHQRTYDRLLDKALAAETLAVGLMQEHWGLTEEA